MAAAAKTTEKKAAAAESADATVDVEPAAAPTDPNQCVVDDGTAHMGRAVNGRVCSAHALRYKADGSPR